ncbi:MAG TPA: alpha/beta hydrolase family protein [Gemmatimonadota bacterium]|nr:alpha/beta hydrolase family protein [Gemmatimonadota bacterium]
MTRALAALLLLAFDPGRTLEFVLTPGSDPPLALQAVPRDSSPADTLIDVGGRSLEVMIRRGKEPVAIVFENGGGATFVDWEAVPDSIAARTGATVVTYNRAGLGRSDLGPETLTPVDEIRALIGALDSLGVPERRILVGQSYGGLLVVVHADLDPDRIAALVLVEAMNSRFIRATGEFIYSTVPSYSDPADDSQRLIMRMTRTLEDLAARAHAVEPALRIPIVVITAGEPWWWKEGIPEAWSRSHTDIAAAAPGRELIVAEGSRHHVAADRPDVVVDAILRAYRAATQPD